MPRNLPPLLLSSLPPASCSPHPSRLPPSSPVAPRLLLPVPARGPLLPFHFPRCDRHRGSLLLGVSQPRPPGPLQPPLPATATTTTTHSLPQPPGPWHTPGPLPQNLAQPGLGILSPQISAWPLPPGWPGHLISKASLLPCIKSKSTSCSSPAPPPYRPLHAAPRWDAAGSSWPHALSSQLERGVEGALSHREQNRPSRSVLGTGPERSALRTTRRIADKGRGRDDVNKSRAVFSQRGQSDAGAIAESKRSQKESRWACVPLPTSDLYLARRLHLGLRPPPARSSGPQM